MSSNVMWTICPQCAELNSAIVSFADADTYKIVCQYCHHVFESGRLPWESVRLLDMDIWDDRDGETGETGPVGDPGMYGGDEEFWVGYPWEN